MRLTFRKTVRVGPVRLNFGRSGFTSWGLKFGRVSWNARTRKTSVDLPGPINLQTDGRK